MLLNLLRFELLYQSKQRALPIAALLFFALGCFMGNAGNAPAMVDFNAPFQISYYTGNFSLFSIFIIMFFAVSGTIRDDKYRMDLLINSTSVKKSHFFWSRFIGVFLFSVIGYSLFLPGYLVGLSISDLDAARIAPFHLKSYLWPFLVIIIPNVFICASLLFSVSLLTKSNMATYAGAIFMYILYFIVGIYSNSPMFATSVPASPEQMANAALMDPFAISTFFEHTQFWTPYEKSNLFLSFSGNYFWNRTLWVGFSFAVLGATYYLFSFRKTGQKRKKTSKVSTKKEALRRYRPAKIQLDLRTQWSAFLSSVKIETKETIQSLPFIALIGILLIALVFELYAKFYDAGGYGESWYTYTNLVIGAVIEVIPILSKILIVFYSGELIWKARDRKFDGILNATPASNPVFFFSKLTTLILIPLLLIAITIVVCLAFQLFNGFTAIDFRQYLLLFYHYGIPALVYSCLAIFVQTTLKSKYLGMGVTGLILLAFTTPVSFNLGIEHPMLRIGVMPSIGYSNMTGYDIQARAFPIYALYWGAFALILSLISLKFWNRQVIEPLSFGKAITLKKWKRSEILTLSFAVILFSAVGSMFYSKLNTEGDYKSTNNKMYYCAQYEQKFKQYASLPTLYYAHMKTEVDIYPGEEKYTVAADYQLINHNTVPITKIFITETKKLSDIQFENAELIWKDTVFGTYLFGFNEPILPQETIRMRYQLCNQSVPFKPDQTIVKNGTFIRHEVFEPTLGYKQYLELSDPDERKKRGLAKQEKALVYDQNITNTETGKEDVLYETIVSTAGDQIALAPGNLIRKWTKDGRNFFQYKYPEKNLPFLAYSSANYEVKKQLCNEIDIEYYYSAGHDVNHKTIAASTSMTLSYCMENFGNYIFDHLRVAETPAYYPAVGAVQPGLINMMEDKLYLIDGKKSQSYDVVAKRISTEIGHLWWGMLLTPTSDRGAGFLSQGLTEYTAAVVLEKLYGKGVLWELNKSFNENYSRGRAFASLKESPLYLERGEKYLTSAKSGLVTLAIRDLIGEKQFNTVLRNLIQQDSASTNYQVNTLNFLDELYKVSPKEHHQLIDEWMKEIIRYELTIDKAEYKILENGKYEITATISAKRFKTLSSGEEVEIGIDEPIKIGCFDKHPENIGKEDQPLYLKDHQIKDGLTTIKMYLDTLPKYIGVDPFLTRVDRNYSNNIKEIDIYL
ncbi:MAG: M1 family aminopeptidase [Bacteroidota bacterium]